MAAFVRPGTSLADRIMGVDAAAAMEPVDMVTLLFCLQKDTDSQVRMKAAAAFEGLSSDTLLAYCASQNANPAILDQIARTCSLSSTLVDALLNCPSLPPQTAELLNSKIEEYATTPPDAFQEELTPEETEQPDESPDQPDQEQTSEDDYLSKYQMIQLMGIGEKIKMALTGDKEWRAILVKDANKLVSGSVIKNPRITDGEILTIIKAGVQNDEIIRLICANKDWIKNYAIRKALIECPKTPLPNALRYLSTMSEKDIAGYAKSKNISSVISTNAKRLNLAKKR